MIADAEQALDAAQLRRPADRDLSGAEGRAAGDAPAGWRMLVDGGEVPAEVRLRMTAGEPLARDLADAIGAGPSVRLWNLYGPTETTIYSGGAAVGPSPDPIEISSIIAGTQLYVLEIPGCGRFRPASSGRFTSAAPGSLTATTARPA